LIDSAQSRRRTLQNPLPRPGGGHGGKWLYHGVRALLVVEGRIHWRKGRVRLERAIRKGPHMNFVDGDDRQSLEGGRDV